MLASPPASEVARHHSTGCGHAKMAQVDQERVGQSREMMRASVVPRIVKAGCRHLYIFSFDDGLKNQRIHRLHFPVYRSLPCQEVLAGSGSRKQGDECCKSNCFYRSFQSHFLFFRCNLGERPNKCVSPTTRIQKGMTQGLISKDVAKVIKKAIGEAPA